MKNHYEFYAVLKGRKPGIYKSNTDAQRQVKGYSGAKYKGFKTKAEAEKYMKTGRYDEHKFYAVKVGRNTGIFRSWSEAEKQISGYPGGLCLKFKTKEEALACFHE